MTRAADTRQEFLFKVVDDQTSFSGIRDQLTSFEALYLSAFPDANEREEPGEIYARLRGAGSTAGPVTFLVLAEAADRSIAGLLIVDWYMRSQTAHITYLTIAEKYRKCGLSRKLVTQELPDALRKIELREKFNFNAVFLEAHPPWHDGMDAFNPDHRMAVFENLGARWIPVDYVQPRLPGREDRARSLILMCLPRPDSLRTEIFPDVVSGFLADLYHGLGIQDPGTDHDFRAMTSQLAQMRAQSGAIPLRALPRKEHSRLRFSGARIALQFVEDTPFSRQAKSPEHCPWIHSFETDLFSHQSQVDPPFWTLLEPPLTQTVTVLFPGRYEYTSEGNTRTLASGRTSVRLSLQLASTTFRKSGIRGFHLLLSTAADEHLTEHELIKLSSFFGSRQENSSARQHVQFSLGSNTEPLSATELVTKLFHSVRPGSPSLSTGIVQVNTESCEYQAANHEALPWQEVYSGIAGADHLPHHKEDRFAEAYLRSEGFRYAANAFCGISLGIFDFCRMDISEVKDTLRAILSGENHFLIMNRGSLFYSQHDASWSPPGQLLMSPYLLIPNMLLAHNEFIARRAESRIDEILRSGAKNERQINARLRESEFDIDVAYIKNIFHYPSERCIFEYGSSHRGIVDLAKSASRKSAAAEKIIMEIRDKRESRRDLAITMLLAIISCMQLATVFDGLFGNDHAMATTYTLGLAVFVAGAIFALKKY